MEEPLTDLNDPEPPGSTFVASHDAFVGRVTGDPDRWTVFEEGATAEPRRFGISVGLPPGLPPAQVALGMLEPDATLVTGMVNHAGTLVALVEVLLGWPERLRAVAEWLDVAERALDVVGAVAEPYQSHQLEQARGGLPRDAIQRDVRTLAVRLQVLLHALDGRKVAVCRRCGCTEGRACPGGCFWVEDPEKGLGKLCSACLPHVRREAEAHGV